jgi:hypothetical protein
MRITADQIYRALLAELDHPQGYITKDCSLDSVTVDGDISCESIAGFLNALQPQDEQ